MSEQWKPGGNDQALGRELRDTLVRHAEEGTGRSIDLATVQGRARRIRRNRRAAVAGSLAAVVAVVAPLAVVGGHALRSEGPPPVTHQQRASGLAIPYLRGSTLVLPDGTPRELPRWFQEGAVQGGDLYGVYGTEETGGNRLVVVHPDGSAEDFVDIGSNLARNEDGSVLAWAKENGDLVLHSADGEFGVDAPQYFLPRGVVGDAGCAAEGTCLVYGDLPEEGAFVGWQLGYTLPPGSVSISDMTKDGLVAYVTKRTPRGPCSAVFDPATGADTFQTCEWDLFRFSREGAYVSAAHYDYEGSGDRLDMAILEATTGDPVAVFTPEKGQQIYAAAWEDADHLLVEVHDRQGWSVIRLGADGSQDIALAPYENNEQFPAFTLLADW